MGGLRGAADRMLELWRVNEALEMVGGILRRDGGLHRRRLLVVAILGGAREVERLAGVFGRVTGDNKRRQTGEDIA